MIFSGDTSGQSEPLLSSFDEPPTTVSISSQHGYTTSVKEDEHNLITQGPDTPLLINYEVNIFLKFNAVLSILYNVHYYVYAYIVCVIYLCFYKFVLHTHTPCKQGL